MCPQPLLEMQTKLARRLKTRVGRPSAGTFAAMLVLTAVVFRFTQPQAVIPVLAMTRVQLWLGIAASLIWITQWRECLVGAAKWFAFFLLLTGGLVVLGKVWDTFIHNDRIAFFIWRDFALMGVSAVLPVAALFPYGKRIRSFCLAMAVCGLLIAVYALGHSGRGPGSWVADENDVCFVLVMLLPFSLLLWNKLRGSWRRTLLLTSSVVILAGIVATNSRGGFVGLVCMLAYLFYGSRRKGVLLLSAALVGAVAVPFVPAEYWAEMSSIADVSSGTAQSRREFWGAALELWLYPPHFLAGIGIGNSGIRLGEMVGEATFYGRAVHSMYFQLLPELGLVGIVFFLLMAGGAVYDNRRAQLLNRRVLTIIAGLHQRRFDKEQEQAVAVIGRELLFVEQVLRAVMSSWAGLLTSGAFISVLYYPPMWILLGFSVAVQRYARALNDLLEDFLEEYEREGPTKLVEEES